MPLNPFALSRRCLLQRAGILTTTAVMGSSAFARPSAVEARSGNIVIAQLVDFSQGQQDVSRDFLTGSRAAWQDINLSGGIRGRQVQHIALETDGSPASVLNALESIKDNLSCIALSGSVGDSAATQMVALMQKGGVELAHAAPWLQNANLEIDNNTFPIFAARQEQIAYAMKTLSVMGLKELGTVYGSAREDAAYSAEVQRTAESLKLKVQAFPNAGNLRLLGQKMTPATPAVILFVGGTPELAEFTKGLEKQERQRYIVALADVNLQTMQQMGAARNTPVIATQPVPLANSSLPIIRRYRETLSRLFDEAPSSLSLAGFIAARYTYQVLSQVDAPLTRPSALAAFQRRSALDIGGFRINFDTDRRSSNYVTQSMMALDGRQIG